MRIMGGKDANGNKLLLAPVDYLTWNERLAGALSDIDHAAGEAKGQIWLLGTASETAQRKLKERGWTIETQVGNKIGVNELGLLKK